MSSTLIRGSGMKTPTDFFLNAPNYVNNSTIGSTGVLLTIPTGAQYVRLCGNVDFWVCWGSSNVSTVTTGAGGGSELVPSAGGGLLHRQMTTLGTTMISVLSTAAVCSVTQSWWTV